jgi:hypothetical protein
MEIPLEPVASTTSAYAVLPDTTIANGTGYTECGDYPSDSEDANAKKQGYVGSWNARKVILMLSEPIDRKQQQHADKEHCQANSRHSRSSHAVANDLCCVFLFHVRKGEHAQRPS